MKRRFTALYIALILIISIILPAYGTELWDYEVSDNGVLLVKCLMEGPDAAVPEKMGGIDVISISPDAFSGCKSLENVMFQCDIDLPNGLFDGFENIKVLCQKDGKVEAYCIANSIPYDYRYSGTAVNVSGGYDSSEGTNIITPTTEIRLGVNQTWQCDASLDGEGALTYKIQNKVIASVDENGLVTARKKGTTKLKIFSGDGEKKIIKITVVSAPLNIKAVPVTDEIGVGESVKINTTLPVGTAASLTYTSKQPDIATVDENGVITGVSVGRAKIVVRSHNNKKSKFYVYVGNAPTKITCEHPEIMGVKQTYKLLPEIDENAHSSFTFTSSDPTIAKVSKKGNITAKAEGDVVITVSTYVSGVSIDLPIKITPAPTSISLGVSSLKLGLGETYQLNADTGGMGTKITYTSSSRKVASVSSDGLVTALKKGATTIKATTHNGRTASVKVNVLNLPSSIRIQNDDISFYYKDTFPVTYSLPKNTQAQVTFSVEDESVCTVGENGLLSGVAAGTTTVTVTTSNGLSDSAPVIVYDDTYPTALELVDDNYCVNEGSKIKFELKFTPEDADTSMKWKSSDKKIATVDDDGIIRGVSHGLVTITGTSKLNKELTVSSKVIVLSDKRLLQLPEKKTDVSRLQANLAKIDAVKESAMAELECDLAERVMDSKEYKRRKGILDKAFEMYRFPFTVSVREPYWKAANSNGGAKDFVPDVMYYGMPYTSHSNTRKYNNEKALNEKYYVPAGDHYMMNQSKKLDGTYVGNDCSAFCSMAIWGANSSHSYMRTVDIYSSPLYETISDTKSLRPGDIIVKANAHVIMFLYYANEEKTQAVIIEQGGSGKSTNTIWTSIARISYYTEQGYIPRRLRSYN